tara:strand:- start:130 stop:2082 length:1953 start_codon:yes stop_codon:yes gene_type:complete
VFILQGILFGMGDKQEVINLVNNDAVDDSAVVDDRVDIIQNNVVDDSVVSVDRVSDGLIKQYSFFDSISSHDIPSEYQNYLYVDFVDVDFSLIRDRFIIRGYNKLKGRVYINDILISCDKNGFFSYDYHLKEYGKQVIYVTFTTMDNQFVTVEKKINYLYDPTFLLKDVNLKRKVTYFYNSDFYYLIKNKRLEDVVTRADLAYFLFNLRDDSENVDFVHHVVNDVNKDDWYDDSVNYVLHNQLMGAFLDGNFYPDREISRLELLVTLIRFLNKDLSYEYNDFVFQDFPRNHWSSKFVLASLDVGLISKSSNLEPDKMVTLFDFIKIVTNMNVVKNKFLVLDDLEQGYDNVSDDLFDYLRPVVSFLATSNDSSMFQLDILSHKSYQVVYQQNVVLEGRVVPSLPFFIDSSLVTPNVVGAFSYELQLEPGVNSISISRDSLAKPFTLLYLTGYKDLLGHWLEDLAAKLNYLDLLIESIDFQPKMLISRYDFLVNSYPFLYPLIDAKRFDDVGFEDELGVTQSITVSDLEEGVVDKDYFDFLIKHDVFSLFENNQFYPDRHMTRIEAIAAITKFMSLVDDQYVNYQQHDVFPFWDVPSSHWGRSYLEVAYYNRLISKNNNFYPDKSLTKDQLIALLSKTNYAKKQLALVFAND